MWDDLPKKNSANMWLIGILIIIVLGVLGFIGYVYYKNSGAVSLNVTPSPNVSGIKSGNPSVSPSPKVSMSPTISPSPTVTVDLKIPENETLVTSSIADTNGDNKDETLVITKMKDGKYHAYVLSYDGQSLFDDKQLTMKPQRIATQIYDSSKESYLSWMLIFTEDSGSLAFIHFNGTKYEIPQNNMEI